MGEFFYRLRLIIWKNYLLRRRHKKRTIIEILWPLSLFLVLMWVRTRGLTTNIKNCHMIPKALPSVGGFEFIQNVFCSLTNPCFDFHVEDIDHWNSSLINFNVRLFEGYLETLPWESYSQSFQTFWDTLDANSSDRLPREATNQNISSTNSTSDDTRLLKLLGEIDKLLVRLNGTRSSNATQDYSKMFCGNLSESSINTAGPKNLSSGSASFLDDAKTKFTPDPDASPECNKIFEMFSETAAFDMLWRVFKIYVRGVIYFVPDNNFTRAVMEKVEDKIQELKGLEDNVIRLLEILRRLQSWEISNHAKIALAQIVLQDPQMSDTLFQKLGVSNPDKRQEILILLEKMSRSWDSKRLPKILNETISLVENVAMFLKCVKYDKIKGFDTEKQAMAAAMPLIEGNRIWAVVIFNVDNNSTTSPKILQYKIRMDSDKVDKTLSISSLPTSRKRPRRRPLFDLKYISYGFAYLEEMLERAVTEIITGKSMEGVMTYFQQFPFPCYIFDEFIGSVTGVFPLLMILSWIYSAAMMIKYIVYEKENHLKEMMKIVGLSNFTHWLGWFIDNFAVLFSSATILTLVLKFGKIWTYSDFTLIWFFLLSYTISVISFSFMFSTFFNKANSAAAAGGIMFFMSYMPYSFTKTWLQYGYLQWYHVIPTCLFSNAAFGYGCNYFAQMEFDAVGAQWAMLNENNDSSFFELRYSLMMLWCDSFLYLLVALYVEAVSPGSGIPKPWNFLCLPSTYFRRKGESRENHKSDEIKVEETPFLEPVLEDLTCGVMVRGLSKTYPNGHVALQNLNMDFYENQITSFLGHNGAGKTTTISILIGLFPPTKGTAFINGFDITKDVERSRKNIGVCPQYNIFFDRLTVSEHIIFFSALKGKQKRVTQDELDRMLNDLDIPEKSKEFPKNLSGGMKRKLCVAIAFSGGSKTIFLDEPTSGVDPFSRRSIWELLLKYKKGRTIILTTHFMDEADILGDRIAIISQGTLKTCGSSLYLKNHFGKGYSLHLVRKQQIMEKSDEQRNSKAAIISENIHPPETTEEKQGRNVEVIVSFVKARIPEARLATNVGTEISFLLPHSSVSLFPKLFNDLDESLPSLDISSYGISDTSLEDVFLNVIAEDLRHSNSVIKQPKCSCKCCGCCLRHSKEQKKVSVSPVKPILKIDPNIDTVNPLEVERTSLNNDTSSGMAPLNPTKPSILEKNEVPDSVLKSVQYINSENGEEQPKVTAKRSSVRSVLSASLALVKSKMSLTDQEVAIGTGSKLVTSRTLLYFTQLRAIILKRFTSSRRNLKSLFFEIFLPSLFVAAALIFTTILPETKVSPPLEITPYKYPSPLHVFFSDGGQSNNLTNISGDIPIGTPFFSRMIDRLTGPIGFSTECLKYKVNAAGNQCEPKRFSNKSVQDFHLNRNAFKSVKMGKCSCTSGTQICENAERKPPPMLKTHAKSVILDASKYVLPEWLLKTYFKHFDRRVGGYQLQVHKPYPVNITRFLGWLDYVTITIFKNNNSQSVAAPSFTPGRTANAIRIWFNNKAYISSIAYLNAFHNMILRDLLIVSGRNDSIQAGLGLYQHPLNLTEFQSYKESFVDVLVGLFLAICMINALSYVPASFVLYLIQERACGGKHLHLVSGVKPLVYWISNFIYDMTMFLVPVAISLLLFLIFNVQAFISQYTFLAFTTLLILYGWSVIPLMYPASHIFSVPSTAFVVLACTNIFIGVTATISEFVLQQFPDEELQNIAWYLKNIFIIFPQYCLGRGMINLVILQTYSQIHHGLSIKYTEPDRFAWTTLTLGKFLLCLFLQGCVFFTFNLLVEYRSWIYMKIVRPKPRHSKDDFNGEDEDVHEERQLVLTNSYDPSSVLVAQTLTKFYRKKEHPAVNGIAFAIRRGECFGLLGINGAGKTSTFKMLTGDVLPSGGIAMISGYNAVLDRDNARKHLGYCPQEDGLDLLLNAEETIQLYGSLRGLKSKDKKQASKKLIKSLGLSQYSLRKCGTYSGGNKRKLSTAIALIGDPDIIFLDEPTSGMDPGARRQLWKVILYLTSIQKSVVLTTHSMEECEALCSRVGIMVNGKFECLGSTQHLKNRFGSGYMLTVRCVEDKQASFLELMQEKMEFAKLISSHCSQVKMGIAQEDAKLSYVFELMHSIKQSGLVEEYSVSQTTLDDIFVKFAKHQLEE
ncbi:unnamed protein product [Allacma fusca]|uniref:ABC transporter domain-containing protein n=1 Tax=Allacma fusca TaxID=39272 RepID=A0A8J2NWX5_9HEXA|nr:unnamed protein product [Allacma fusca]